ncbi:unnamed protein product, partial [Ectocarpus sp. 4 AP-2014]
FRFWNGSNDYKIHMGNAAEYQYGPVTDYSIKMNMINMPNRGWTWGVNGVAPIAALNTQGNMQIKGSFTAENYILTTNPNNYSASVALSWLNDVARIRVGGVNAGASNGLAIQGPADTNLLRVMGDGNVGIGTSTPTDKLQVNGTTRVGDGSWGALIVDGIGVNDWLLNAH